MLAAAAAPRVVVAFSLPAFAPAAVLVTTGAGLANSPALAPGATARKAFPCDDANTPLAFSAPMCASMLSARRFTATCEEAGYGNLSERRVARCVPDATRHSENGA